MAERQLDFLVGPFDCECGNMYWLDDLEWYDCWIAGEFVPACPECGKEQVWNNKPYVEKERIYAYT